MTIAGRWRTLGALSLLAGASLSCARIAAKDPQDAGQGADAVAVDRPGPGTGGGGAGGQIIINVGGRGGGIAAPPLTDFPADPILTDATVPANAPTLFDAAGRPGISARPASRPLSRAR
jgi:hypothetical protein